MSALGDSISYFAFLGCVYCLYRSCYNLCTMNEDLFFYEPLTENIIREIKVDKVYYEGNTKYQFVQCFYNKFLGKVLFLDKKIQSAEIDEFVYHESLVHPALITHPHPQKVLIIGGGEGATLREVLKHETVQKVTMVDIDEELVSICRKYLPEWSDGAFSNPKSCLVFSDARAFLEKTDEKFDVIISDLTEPLESGPSACLFTKQFFEKMGKALEKSGLIVLQAGSVDPYYFHFYASCVKTLEAVFPKVRPYWTFVLSFSLPWGFVLASQGPDPLEIDEKEASRRVWKRKIKKLKFYHSGLHNAFFALPRYLIKNLKKARVITDEKPFIWEL